MEDDNAWFLPKRYGYGAGLPIAWQGWALLGGFFLLICGAGMLFMPGLPAAFAALVLFATAALWLIAKRKTRGGWHWRWGGRD